MVTPTKGISLFFFTTLAILAAAEQKTKIGQSESISVSQAAKIAVPIEFTAIDYNGPYDPADPKGIGAATRRQMNIEGKKNAEIIKSYIPPGIDKLAKKEVVKLALSEGKRFALSHPREAADIVGIATKAKGLVSAATNKLKQLEKEKAKEKKKN